MTAGPFGGGQYCADLTSAGTAPGQQGGQPRGQAHTGLSRHGDAAGLWDVGPGPRRGAQTRRAGFATSLVEAGLGRGRGATAAARPAGRRNVNSIRAGQPGWCAAQPTPDRSVHPFVASPDDASPHGVTQDASRVNGARPAHGRKSDMLLRRAARGAGGRRRFGHTRNFAPPRTASAVNLRRGLGLRAVASPRHN
jgi:hypothetical protein